MYPTKCEIDGKLYNINTDYKVALACFKAINDNDITDIERAYAIVGLLFDDDDIPVDKALDMASKYLCCGKDTEIATIKKDMDFEYDKDYIMASFMSDYGIDLEVTDMHWWKYCSLISGLTEKCILNKVRDIRNTDLSEYKDVKNRNKIMRAMKNVALPIERTKEEEEMLKEFEALLEEEGGIING